jgi:hypothetical protein
MAPRSKVEARRALGGGIVAGIVAGLVLAAFLIVMNLIKGDDVWVAAKMAGAPFLGERAMQPGFDAVAILVGVLCHMAVSIGWGVGFGLLFYGLSRGTTVAMGAIWGVVSWLVMFYVVLPIAGVPEIAEGMPIGMAIFEHVLFGVVLAVAFLPYQRRIVHPYPRVSQPVAP